MKTLVELYRIFLNEFDIHYRSYWLCNTIKHSNVFSLDEKRRLLTHFSNQKPSETQYVEFFNDKRFGTRTSQWWERNEKQVRVDFLEAIIKKLQKEFAESNY